MWFEIEKFEKLGYRILRIGETNGKVSFGFQVSESDLQFLSALLKDEGF